MSILTWKEEFYPVPASKVSSEEAVQHSLRKWEGLRPENLRKHKVSITGGKVTDDEAVNLTESVGIDSTSCALCFLHRDDSDYYNPCNACPLMRTHGRPCDKARQSPWSMWVKVKDPEPMISFLREALTQQQENQHEA